MNRIIGMAYLLNGQTNTVKKTGANRKVEFRGGSATIVDEQSMVALLKDPSVQIQYSADWYDFYPKHLEAIGGEAYLQADVLAIVRPEPEAPPEEPGIDYTARKDPEPEPEPEPDPEPARGSRRR